MSVQRSPINRSNEKAPPGSPKMPQTNQNATQPISPMYRNYLTFSLYISFMALGMTGALNGPTFLHLTYILDTDIETLAVTHTFASIGYLSGSLLCGLLFDLFNSELQFALVTFLQGTAIILAPWAPSVYVYYAVDFLKAMTSGYLCSSGQGYVIGLWTEHAYKESVGAILAPNIILPFLSELPTDGAIETASNFTTDISSNVTGKTLMVDADSVRYGFAIVGGIIVCMSFCFFAGFCMIGPTCLKQKKERQSPNNAVNRRTEEKNNNTWKILMILCFEFLFYVFYAWCEKIPAHYLSSLVIKGLGWDIKYGPIITSVFWGFIGLGRIAAIPISYFITPGKMVAINLTLTVTGFTLMVVALLTNDLILWIAIAIAAFGMASTFASLILWTSNYIEITGAVGACFLTGSSFGLMTSGTLTGYLFQHYSHIWVGVLCLLGCLADICLYVLIFVLAKVLLKPEKKGNTNQEEQEFELMKQGGEQ